MELQEQVELQVLMVHPGLRELLEQEEHQELPVQVVYQVQME
jgi:hypothetical protein